jgi:hypothetical protein
VGTVLPGGLGDTTDMAAACPELVAVSQASLDWRQPGGTVSAKQWGSPVFKSKFLPVLRVGLLAKHDCVYTIGLSRAGSLVQYHITWA